MSNLTDHELIRLVIEFYAVYFIGVAVGAYIVWSGRNDK